MEGATIGTKQRKIWEIKFQEQGTASLVFAWNPHSSLLYYTICPFYCLLAHWVYKTKPTIPSPCTLTGMYKSVKTSTKEPRENGKSALSQEKRKKSTTPSKVWLVHSIPSKDLQFLYLHKHHKIHRDTLYHTFHLLLVRQPICQHSKSTLLN